MFNTSWSSSYNLQRYIFAINQTGTWINSEAIPFSGKNNVSTNITKINAIQGTTVEWKFYAQDIYGTWNVTDTQSFVVGGNSGTLSALLISPTGANNQPVNQTFVLYANVTCSGTGGASCGNVNGTLLYNATSSNPSNNITGGGNVNTPFYTLQNNPLSCGSMTSSSSPCALNWTVNTTGTIGSTWKLAVNFTSTDAGVSAAITNTTNITIIDSSLSITISTALQNVNFGTNLNPGSNNNTALNNSNSLYNITCAYLSGNCNVSIKANNPLAAGVTQIGAGNVTWNQANTITGGKRLSLVYQVINLTLTHLTPQSIYFWLDVPNSTIAGTYVGNFTIQGQPN
jgi:hypothetical protein